MLLCRTLDLAILLLHCFVAVQTAKRRFNLEIYNFTCSNPNKSLLQHDCEFKKLSANNFAFSRRLVFQRDVGREMDVRLLIQALPQNGRKIIKFLDFKMNLCDGLALTLKNPLIMALMAEMRKTGNVPYSCPLKADVSYFVENYSVTDRMLPLYTPYLNFTYSLMTYENGLMTSNAIVKGAVVPYSE